MGKDSAKETNVAKSSIHELHQCCVVEMNLIGKIYIPTSSIFHLYWPPSSPPYPHPHKPSLKARAALSHVVVVVTTTPGQTLQPTGQRPGAKVWPQSVSVFRPSATKSGRPYRVTSVSSLSWRTAEAVFFSRTGCFLRFFCVFFFFLSVADLYTYNYRPLRLVGWSLRLRENPLVLTGKQRIISNFGRVFFFFFLQPCVR